MKYRTLGKTGIKSSVLGFGGMRLPLNSGNPEDVNLVETRKMLEYAVEHGVNMFDTALVYHTTDRSKPGVSESVMADVLNPFYDSIHVSTKMPSWNILSWDYFNETLDKHLDRLEKESIELFFVHSIKDVYYDEIKNAGLYEFIDKALSDGRIEHVGFSTHGSIQLLDKILEDYEKWEFALTQINYLDNYENPGLEGLKKLNKLNIGTMIMEPLRGGQLAENLPKQVTPLLEKSEHNYSPLEWAFNYLWDKKEVNCVLSGMSNLEQVKQNITLAEKSENKYSPLEWAFNYLWDKKEVNCVLSGMSNLEQVKQNIALADKSETSILTKEDQNILKEVQEEYKKLKNIPCTECQYCMPCPFGVYIPKCFKEYNMDKISGSKNKSVQYKFHMHDDRKAHNCTQCGKCVELCPQSINISEQLKIVEKHFEE